jgi:predicted amidohydrolase YtcJ
MCVRELILASVLLAPVLAPQTVMAELADLILHHGKVLTVDQGFSVRSAVAIQGERILRVGSDEEVLQTRGLRTAVYDLQGQTVLPGLIDSHLHPSAAMTEFDHAIPNLESIADVLDYIRARAKAQPPGTWIEVRQVFITRLREQRYPTRAELDQAAPNHPVLFATNPDASLSSLALKLSGLDRNFKVSDGGPGYAETDPQTGDLTGILRSCTRCVKVQPAGRKPTEEDHYQRTLELFRDYQANGLTCVADRDAMPDAIERYRRMRAKGDLPVRLCVSHHIDTLGPMAEIQERIRAVARDPLCQDDPVLRIIGIKIYLDGGMLTGSAYMRQPWGVSQAYAIRDPAYRGVLFVPKDRLRPLVEAAVQSDLQFTAHSVGDGAVHTLLDVYDEVSRTRPIRATRPCISHANFMSAEAVAQFARLGVCADMQPAWLYLDTRTLERQFGYDRLRWFQPLHSLFAAGVNVGGGSDHMQKIGSLRAIPLQSLFGHVDHPDPQSPLA